VVVSPSNGLQELLAEVGKTKGECVRSTRGGNVGGRTTCSRVVSVRESEKQQSSLTASPGSLLTRVPVFAVETKCEEVPVDVKGDAGACVDGARCRKQQKRDEGG